MLLHGFTASLEVNGHALEELATQKDGESKASCYVASKAGDVSTNRSKSGGH
jgi:hypothetical protein